MSTCTVNIDLRGRNHNIIQCNTICFYYQIIFDYVIFDGIHSKSIFVFARCATWTSVFLLNSSRAHEKHNFIVVGSTISLGLIAVIAADAVSVRNPYTVNYARLAGVQEASHPNGRSTLCKSCNIVLSYPVVFRPMAILILCAEYSHGFVEKPCAYTAYYTTRGASAVKNTNINS